MVTICCISHSDCNKPLIMTHCCWNEWISRIKWITLVNAHDFEYCAAWSVFPSIWKQRYYFPGGGSFWSVIWVMYLCWNCSESDPKIIWSLGTVKLWFFCLFQTTVHHHHPTKYEYLVQWHSDIYSGSLKLLVIVITHKNGHLVQWHCDILFWKFQTTEHHHNPTKSGPLVQWHYKCFSGSFKRLLQLSC